MDQMTRRELESLAAHLKTREDFDEARDVLRWRWAQLMAEEVMQFGAGQRVRWSHGGSWHTGIVRRRNARTLTVAEDGLGSTWRISPAALTPAGTAHGFY